MGRRRPTTSDQLLDQDTRKCTEVCNQQSVWDVTALAAAWLQWIQHGTMQSTQVKQYSKMDGVDRATPHVLRSTSPEAKARRAFRWRHHWFLAGPPHTSSSKLKDVLTILDVKLRMQNSQLLTLTRQPEKLVVAMAVIRHILPLMWADDCQLRDTRTLVRYLP